MSARRQLRLLRYGLRHIPSLVALTVSMILTIGVDILKPFPLKLLVDNVLGAHSVHGLLAGLPGAGDKHVMLIWVVAGEILVFVAYTVLDMVSSYTATALSTRMTYDLGADLFLHVQHLGLRFHSNRSVGDTTWFAGVDFEF